MFPYMTYISGYYRDCSLRLLKRNKGFATELHGGILSPLKFMWLSIFSYQYFLEASFNKGLMLQEGVQEIQKMVQTY